MSEPGPHLVEPESATATETGPEAIAGTVPVSSGSRLHVGPAHLAVHESVKDEMILSGSGSDEQVQLLRDRHDGALTMKYSATSPHYNDGNTVMTTPVDMTVAAALLGVEPDELTPVIEAAGRALGSARDRIDDAQSNDSLSPQKVWSYAAIKAVAQGGRAPESSDVGDTSATQVSAGGSFTDGLDEMPWVKPVPPVVTWRELREARPTFLAGSAQALPPDMSTDSPRGPSMGM